MEWNHLMSQNNTPPFEMGKLVGKIVADKKNRKLGKVFKIEEIKDKKTNIPKPHLLVLVKKFLRTDIIVVVDANKILKTDDFHVWLDLSKEDFEREVRETRALISLMRG